MTKPFRFAVQLSTLPADGWQDLVRRIQALGFSTLFFPDHFHSQLDPVAGLASVAAATDGLRVGSLVYDVDYRHPVVLAKASATIQLLSGGRHEFGIGAGWMESDYREAGIPFDPAGVRIERLDEAIQIIRAMWQQERTSFEGSHYQICEIAQAVELGDMAPPPILVGGGGPKVLRLAGRHADIVGINPKVHQGRVVPETAADLAPERVRQKIRWVAEGADSVGRSLDDIEFNSLTFVVKVTDEPESLREALGRNSGMTPEEVADCPLFLIGSASEIRDRLAWRREQYGISYVVIQGGDTEQVEQFAEEVVKPLAGN